MLKTGLAFSLMMAVSVPALSQNCEKGRVYVAHDDPDGVYQLVTGEGVASFPVTISRLVNGKALWSVKGDFGCSNGVVVCFLSVPTNEEKDVSVPAEFLRAEKGDQYLIFAHLQQTIFNRYRWGETFSLKAVWHGPKPLDEEAQMTVIPSIFRYKGCK